MLLARRRALAAEVVLEIEGVLDVPARAEQLNFLSLCTQAERAYFPTRVTNSDLHEIHISNSFRRGDGSKSRTLYCANHRYESSAIPAMKNL